MDGMKIAGHQDWRRRMGRLTIVALVGAAAISTTVRVDGQQPSGTVTFTKDVLPILQKSCQSCHRPGTVAPMSLLTYEDVRPWARAIKTRVSARQMPPWHVDRSVGEYRDDPSLSDEQIATIVKWVDAGAPRGSNTDAPPPARFASLDKWYFGEPDLVVTCPEIVVPAAGPDIYPAPEVDSGLTEDRWIKWMQVLPGSPKAVHHSVAYVRQSERANGSLGDGADLRSNALDDPNADDSLFRDRLIEYAIGNNGDQYDGDMGKLLKAGARIVCSEHYHSLGEEVRSTTRVAFGFYPRGYEPKYKVITTAVTPGPISVPPGEPSVRFDAYQRLEKPARIISFQPHMHYRGAAMSLEAIYPDGRKRLLTRVPNYEVVWQVTYTYKEPIVLPAGTMLHVESYYNNSKSNRHNPDPTGWVGNGARTVDEMSNGWTDLVYISEEDYSSDVKAETRRSLTNQNH
jgi:mono/diheme cytochrome c family protein